jgi:hypothetical protein
MNLCMAVVAAGNAVVSSGSLDLTVFQPTEFQTGFFISGLQKAPAAAAAVIVGAVRLHIDKIFFSHDGFHDIPQIFSDGVSVALAHNLAWVLNRKLYFQILVPIGVDIQFAFPDPSGVIFIDVFYFEFVRDIKFFQSCQDRECDVPSFRV